MANYKSDYAGLAQYNNGIAFKSFNKNRTYNRRNPPILSTLRNNVYGRLNTSSYHTLANGYISFPTNCTNVTIPSLVTKEKYTRENFDSESKYYTYMSPHCQCQPNLTSQGGKCVASRENYNKINKPKVIVLSADDWCRYSKLMTAQEDEIKQKLEKAGFDVEFVNSSQNKSKLDTLAKKHGVTGFPTTLVHNRRGETHKISGMMKADQLVKWCEEHSAKPGSY